MMLLIIREIKEILIKITNIFKYIFLIVNERMRENEDNYIFIYLYDAIVVYIILFFIENKLIILLILLI